MSILDAIFGLSKKPVAGNRQMTLSDWTPNLGGFVRTAPNGDCVARVDGRRVRVNTPGNQPDVDTQAPDPRAAQLMADDLITKHWGNWKGGTDE